MSQRSSLLPVLSVTAVILAAPVAVPFQGRNFRLTDVHGEVVQGVLA